MWKNLSEDNISPGLDLLGKLSLNLGPPDDKGTGKVDKNLLAHHVQELTSWNEEASKHIHQMAQQVRRPLLFQYLSPAPLFSGPKDLP